MMSDLAALAVQLARPVVRGMLPTDQAHAALAAAACRAQREGRMSPAADIEDSLRILCHLLQIQVEKLEIERTRVAAAIGTAVRPLLNRREPRNRVRAEAHDVCADAGRPFTEAEVEELLLDELMKARLRAGVRPPEPVPRRGRRYHGR